jgi:hypothetical protein
MKIRKLPAAEIKQLGSRFRTVCAISGGHSTMETSNRDSGKPVSRREFLTRSSTYAAAVSAWLSGKSSASSFPATTPGEISALNTGGIAPAYFEKARQRATALVAKLTLDEKISQFDSSGAAIPRIGLSAFKYYGGESLHGVGKSGPVTSFPVPLALGCSWNRSLVQQVFTAVSDEIWAWHKKTGSSLAMFSPPTVNMGTRDPRWGRIAENYSEDPYLVGQMAVYTIHGMQGRDARYLKTIACAKHYIANDTETDRHETSATVDARSFWEYYSRGFEACVKEGQVFTVMSSYNSLNGIPTTASPFLLTDLLRIGASADTWLQIAVRLKTFSARIGSCPLRPRQRRWRSTPGATSSVATSCKGIWLRRCGTCSSANPLWIDR